MLFRSANGQPVFNQYAFMPDINIHIDPSNVFNVGLKLEQPLFMGGKIIAANRMASIGKEMSELNIRYTENQVILDTEQAFWKYIEVKELLNSAEAYYRVVKELETRVRNAREVGMMRKNDLLKVQVRVNEAEMMMNKAENGLNLASMALCHTIGLPLITKIEINQPIEMNFIDESLLADNDFESRPEFQIVSKDVQLKKREVDLIRSEYLPQLGAAFNYGYANGIEMNDKKMLDNTSYAVKIGRASCRERVYVLV